MDNKEVTINPMISYRYKRIAATFCSDCKNSAKCQEELFGTCGELIFGDGVCRKFNWKSQQARDKHQKEVLYNQAVTGWMNKGRSLEEIRTYSSAELHSVLSKTQLKQFEAMQEETNEELVSSIDTPEDSQEEKVAESIAPESVESPEPAAPVKPKVSFADILKSMTPSAPVKMTPAPLRDLPIPVTPVPVAPSDTPEQATQHLFHCRRPDGKTVTYKRSTKSASYEAEVQSFRKYLAKIGTTIESEEIV